MSWLNRNGDNVFDWQLARECYDPLTLCNYPRPTVSSTWTTTHNIQTGRNSVTGNTETVISGFLLAVITLQQVIPVLGPRDLKSSLLVTVRRIQGCRQLSCFVSGTNCRATSRLHCPCDISAAASRLIFSTVPLMIFLLPIWHKICRVGR